MRITYDAKADALYIYLADRIDAPDTRSFDEDIYIDFNASNQILGIEVLGASERLQLKELMPFLERIDADWAVLSARLLKRKELNLPVETSVRKCKNWVEKIGENYVILRRDETDNTVRVTRTELEEGTKTELKKKRKWAITRALRTLAASS